MKELPKGNIKYRGRIYVRPSYACVLMEVNVATIINWLRKGKISGILLPTKSGTKKIPFILKSSLKRELLYYRCIVCSKEFKSKGIRDPKRNRFCSDKCCTKWWNYNYPVHSNGVRRKRSK